VNKRYRGALRTIHRDLRPAYRAALRQGWTVSVTRRHLRWTPPDRTRPAVSTPSTPGHGRAIANTLADLRRSGLVI
jgi:hypothetical protein